MNKIIVSVTAATVDALLRDIDRASVSDADMIEWRADYLQERANFIEVAKEVSNRAIMPLVFTFRSAAQGGKAAYDDEFVRVYTDIQNNRLADIVDIELLDDTTALKAILARGKAILSYHDFDKTPASSEIIATLERLASFNSDIIKLAFMSKSLDDVTRLILTAKECKARINKEIVAISMGEIGAMSRIIGTSATYAHLNGASAPGQMDVATTRALIELSQSS